MDSDVEPIISDPKLRIVSREEWGAFPPVSKEPMKLPAHRVFFTMTDTKRCMTKDQCIQAAREVQQYYMYNKEMPDLPFSFLIGGDLRVYEGRGWGVKIREAAEPMEQPTWKTGRVVIGYITRSNDNSKHMDKMIEKGYRLMDFGIDNKYLVDFNKHRPFRGVDFDNELEVEKFEEVSRKSSNQCFQGFVPEDEVIFDSPFEDRASDYEMRSEDERGSGGDLFEEIEREKNEKIKKREAEIKKKMENIYGNSEDEDIVNREKRARTYGEEEYKGDYTDHHFREETGSTSELGHSTDGDSSGEMIEYPDWVYSKDDWLAGEGVDDKDEKVTSKHKKGTKDKQSTVRKKSQDAPSVDDTVMDAMKELERYGDNKTGNDYNTSDYKHAKEMEVKKATGGKESHDAPTVDDEFMAMVKELERYRDNKTGNDYNTSGYTYTKGMEGKKSTDGKESQNAPTVKDELMAMVKELESFRDNKTGNYYKTSEDSDGQTKSNGYKYVNKDGIEIPEAGGKEIADAIIGGMSRNKDDKNNLSEKTYNKNSDSAKTKSKRKCANTKRKKRFYKRRSTTKGKWLSSSDEENDPEKIKVMQEYATKAKEMEKHRNAIGDYSPNDSGDEIYRNNYNGNNFMNDSQGFKKDIAVNNTDSVIDKEKQKNIDLDGRSLSDPIIKRTYAEPNPYTPVDDSELIQRVKTASIDVTSDENISKPIDNEKTDDPSDVSVSEGNSAVLNVSKTDRPNRNLIIDHEKYITKLNIAILNKYLRGQAEKNHYKVTEQLSLRSKEESIINEKMNNVNYTMNAANSEHHQNERGKHEDTEHINFDGDESDRDLYFRKETVENLRQEINESNIHIKTLVDKTDDKLKDSKGLVKHGNNTETEHESLAPENKTVDKLEIINSEHEMKNNPDHRNPNPYRKGALFESADHEKFYKDNLSRSRLKKLDDRTVSDLENEVDLLIKKFSDSSTSDSSMEFDYEFDKSDSLTPETVTELESSDFDPIDCPK